MALELRQNLKLAQQLVMTPQLQQAIKLLQLSRIELIETINQELESNPVLEEGAAEEKTPAEDAERLKPREEEGTWGGESMPALASSEEEKTPWEKQALQEVNWQDFWDDDHKTQLPSYSFEQKEAPNYENILTRTSDLTDHLMWQLQMARLSDQERRIGALIIGNLNNNGYLKATVEEIAKEAGCGTEDVERVLKRVQEFDPVGVAARDLRECLLIQVDHLELKEPLVRELISEHLHQIELHNYQAMAKATGYSVEDVAKAIEIITNLEPRPGSSFGSEDIHYIVPDIYVYKVDDEYVVSLNDEGMPTLKISSFYRDAIKNGGPLGPAKEFIQDKLKSALWLMRSIQQRKKTIFKVTQSIVRFQKDFLDKGIAYLKPLILKDVAEDVGMHESTISRVTTNKYVHTPQGIFELKFFFSSGLPRDNGGAHVATHSVKDRIKKLIESEDPTKPYSDKQIMEILAKDSIKIARRTVAKYRDVMGILPSSRRKRPKMK